MARPRGKVKLSDDFCYVVIHRHEEQVPLRTTKDGVRWILKLGGIAKEDLDDFVHAIEQGGACDLLHGNTKSVHRMLPSLKERLKEVAADIKHSGRYGVLWWNAATHMAWWIQATEDTDAAKVYSGAYTSQEDIRRKLLSVKEVAHIRIEREAQPDTRRERGWMEIVI